MTVEIYPSRLESAPLEAHHIAATVTLDQWLRSVAPSYDPRFASKLSIEVDGAQVPLDQWAETAIGPDSSVRVYVEPKEPTTIIVAVVAAVVAIAATILLQPSLPKQRQQQGAGGDNLDEASLKGNKVKLNTPIREVSGTRKVFPDYLLPLHRYFADPRTQIVETLLCVGKGDFDAPLSSVRIGDTPLVSLGDDADFDFFGPGASLAGDSRAVWWHSAPEVGATSTGTAGLELTVTSSAEPVAQATSYVFNGDTVTIPTGAGSFPASWEAGFIVRIEVKYPYTIDDNTGTGGRDVINGDIAQLAFTGGELIEIVGDNAGDFIVFDADDLAGTLELNYSDGSAATALVTGARRMAIGYRGLRYRILSVDPQFITVERLTDTGVTDLTWPGFSNITVDDAVLFLDQSSLEGGFAGPFAACPPGEITDTLELDVFFPGGIIFIGDDGWIAPPFARTIVTVDIQYRDADLAGAWTSVVKQYSNNTQDQIGYTETINLGSSFRPEVRLRRIGAKSTNPRVQDGVQWYGLRSKLQGPTSYAGVTTLALKVRGGGRLSAQSEQLVSVEATRKLPVRVDGIWQPAEATRNIAPWVAYVAKSLGYTDADLDLDELDRLDAIWSARGDYYDNDVSQTSTAKESINLALTAGFAELTIERGKIRPARDEPRETFEHMYTPQNMTQALTRQFRALTGDDFDGVDVEYTDSRTWQVETVQCRLAGDLGLRVKRMRLEGITSRTRAWRIGMRERRSQRYRRFALNWATEMDALNSRYLSYAAVADDVPGYGQSAILAAISASGPGHLLVSSEPFDWSAAGAHVVALRRLDGSLSGPYTATRVDDFRLTIAEPLDFVPDLSLDREPPHLLFGPVTRWNFPVLITEIDPRGSAEVSVSGINYDVRVYADDDNEPPV